MKVIQPAHHRRQRHEDRLGAPARLEAEDGAAIVNQIEFHVAAAAELLETALLVGVGFVSPLFGDRQVSGQKIVAAILHEREERLKVAFEIIEEDAADAARLLAMRQEE